jgi:hypothetical protein
MKLSYRKLQFWEWEKTLLVLEHLVNRPCWYFTVLHAGNVRDGLMFYIFFSIKIYKKIGIWGCIYLGFTGESFPSPDH